ncbi:hydrogenase maturation nickel metallochaperone HypA [Orenia marismortui]|uniref:hydrogenase maturation nickel metallochaperone HypA n=1 Tax=Orenia marismortui TaxID=46469 RepID=UPI00035F1E84|nr:hydrogenase maturation nickel metallochaperone HypA [Orenia marismortui]
MHEMSLMTQLFSIIQEYIMKYGLDKVTKIVLKVGEMSCVEDESLNFAFQFFVKDTKVEGAELIIDRVEAINKCQFCGIEYKADFTNKICPECKRFNYNLISGDEILLEKLEGE